MGDRGAVLYSLHAARGPALVFNGAADTVVAIPRHGKPFFEDLFARVTKLRGGSKGVFDFEVVDGVSHRPFFVTRPVVLWLDEQLDLPNWTAAEIRALPDIRIGDWATNHSVVMDRLYATEEREAGTRALLDDVPGFKREDLSVFTLSEWEKHKDQLVLETWLSRAKNAAESRDVAKVDVSEGWKKSPKNPMLSLGAPSEFDSQNIISPAVAKDGSNYFLFYAGGPSGPKTGGELVRYQLGLALSKDGEKWTKTGKPLLPLGERDNFHVTPALLREPGGNLFKPGGVWHMVYCGNRADDIEHATSRDGLTWEKDPRSPIFKKAYAPNLVQVGEEIRMYYTHKPRSPDGKPLPWELHLATGRDFYSLKPHPGNPVLKLSQPWETGAIIYPYVLREEKTWVMFYAAYWQNHPRAKTATAIGMATSGDGFEWTKHPGNPVLTPTPDSAYDAIYNSTQAILRDGDQYRMYFASRIDMVHKYFAIGMAAKSGSLVSEP